MKIEFNVLDRQFRQFQDEYEAAALRALRSGWYILGKELEAFEQEYAAFNESKYCVGVGSGLDALVLAFRALGVGPGDEVLVPANTFIASVMGVTLNGATPVFVEPDEFYLLDAARLEAAITPRTRAILPVHLYGQICDMDPILEVARRHNLFVVEDCAQAHTARYKGKMAGTFGDIGCFSFFPTKNVGAFGDAGCIVTDNPDLAGKVRTLRNYGSKVKYHNELENGVNSRLDELQAALLRAKLPHVAELIAQRESVARRYLAGIRNEKLILPAIRPDCGHVWHLFVVRTADRAGLMAHLEQAGIHAQIHYPIPPHLAPCYAKLGGRPGDYPIAEAYADQVVSLPLYNGMTDEEVQYVVDAVNSWQ